MNRLLRIASLFLISSPMTVQPVRAELILNGSFENESGGTPHDWISTGNVQVTSSQGETDGLNALAFSFGNVPSNGAISQTFATTAGASYSLTFDFGKYSIGQPLEIARLEVDLFSGTGFDGPQILNQIVADGTPSIGDPDSTDSSSVYSPFQFGFTASGPTSTLRFTDVSDPQSFGGGFDAMLDNVNVSAVPEPSSIALIGLSILAIFAQRRRFMLATPTT